jgi:glycosyltransferase involved in cell wall biosynthesis
MATGGAPVSAVIPCYRCAGTIRRAALSVASQTRRPIELILVDDASGDGTVNALQALRAELGAGWVRIIELPENRGAATARNTGWEAARGEYVAFLDADDSWLPRKIERQSSFMRDHPEFAATGHLAHYGELDAAGGAGGNAPLRYREISRTGVLLRNPMVTPSLMVRRDGKLRFHEGRRHMEDHRFLQELVFANARVARLEEILAVIHKAAFGEGGLSAALWAMERAELGNYRALLRARHIGAILYTLVVSYSLAKYARRCAIVALRRLSG